MVLVGIIFPRETDAITNWDYRALLTNRSRLAPHSRVVSEEKGWWEGDDGPEEEYDGSISWKLNVFKLIQLLPLVATAIWIIVEIL